MEEEEEEELYLQAAQAVMEGAEADLQQQGLEALVDLAAAAAVHRKPMERMEALAAAERALVDFLDK